MSVGARDGTDSGPGEELLADACAQWQSGRDVGSSRLRGAARALTGSPHYFEAEFIAAHERAARSDPATMLQAAILLRALEGASMLDADDWNRIVNLPERGFAGRGIAAKPENEPQMLNVLGSGWLTMPLWGLSLDPQVTRSYGGRFRFEMDGPFPGIPAWTHSGIKSEEQEIIAGGTYRVVDMADEGSTMVVRLRYETPTKPRVGRDPVLLDLMSIFPDAQSSFLEVTPDGEILTMKSDESTSITVRHTNSRPETVHVRVLRMNSGDFSAKAPPVAARELVVGLLDMVENGPIPRPDLLLRVRQALEGKWHPAQRRPISWVADTGQVVVEARNFGDAGVVMRWLQSDGFVTGQARWDYGYEDTVAVLVTDRPTGPKAEIT